MERAVKSVQINETVKAARQITGGEASRLPVTVLPDAGMIQRKAGCSCGGGCPNCSAGSAGNLKISSPDDKYEIEAESIASQVMAMPDKIAPKPQNISQSEPGDTLNRKCTACEKHEDEEGLLMRKENTSLNSASESISIGEVFRHGGQPLAEGARNFFEPRFGYDLSRVRIHTHREAAESAKAVNALAYTVGENISFAEGQYRPDTSDGKKLLAHELTHVVQQTPYLSRKSDGLSISNKTALPLIQRACPATGGAGHTPPVEDCTIGSALFVSGRKLKFCQDSDQLMDGQKDLVTKLLADAATAESITLHGNASVEGPSKKYNFNLSCKRAIAVADLLKAGGITAPISLVSHGPTEGYGTNLENRNVVIELTMKSPEKLKKEKEEEEEKKKPKKEATLCGPDVTAAVADAVSNTKSTFAGWSKSQKENACTGFTSFNKDPDKAGNPAYLNAWDIEDLHDQSWIPSHAPPCASPATCGNTVLVSGNCFYAGSVNYVIFGVMWNLCRGHYKYTGAVRFSESAMLLLVDAYKGPIPAIRKASGNWKPSREWAQSGFKGWAGGISPTGDRPACGTCGSVYSGSPFQVYWYPNGVF